MKEIIDIIVENIKMYNGQSIYLALFVCTYIYMMIVNKKFRKTIGFPLLLIVVLVLNPILYQKVWIKLIGATYWRMFWAIPIVLVIAIAVMDITKRVYKKTNIEIIKLVIPLIFMVIFVVTGKYMYGQEIFQKADNYYKLNQKVINVADKLLEYSDEPTVVAPDSLNKYIRQYDASIKLMYGRNAYGYVESLEYGDVYYVFSQMIKENPDLKIITMLAKQYGYKFIVFEENQIVNEETMNDDGYKKIGVVDGYVIYQEKQE